MSTLSIGDFLLRPKLPGITHVGVWMGGDSVFHNAPDRGEHVSSVAEFAKGENIQVEPKNADPVTVIARVQTKLTQPRGYDPISNNCEHSANDVVTGRAFSIQLRVVAVGIVAVTLGVAYLALRKR